MAEESLRIALMEGQRVMAFDGHKFHKATVLLDKSLINARDGNVEVRLDSLGSVVVKMSSVVIV